MKEARISLSCSVKSYDLSTCVQQYAFTYGPVIKRIYSVLQNTIQVLAAFIPDGTFNNKIYSVIKTVV